MPHPPNAWSIAEARDHALARGVHGVVDTFLQRMVSRSRPGVWVSIADEGALRARADELDAFAAHRGARPLHGVPIAVKDNIDVAGVPTTAGSREFAYTPELSAPAVTSLIEAGAIFVGKTNLDQFATRLSGTCSPQFGICGNPDDPDSIVGGSSSGSAVAVALGLVPIALGTDTAGSGRVPAACCGVVGLKPTRERVSNAGLVPASPSFDTVSVFATSSADAATTFAVLVEPDRARHERGVPLRWRIGVPPTLAWFGDEEDLEIRVGKYDRPHVAAIDDDVLRLRCPANLGVDPLANALHLRHPRYVASNVRPSDFVFDRAPFQHRVERSASGAELHRARRIQHRLFGPAGRVLLAAQHCRGRCSIQRS